MKYKAGQIIKLNAAAEVTLSYKEGSPPQKYIKNSLWIIDAVDDIDNETQSLNISTYEPDGNTNAGSFCSYVSNYDVKEIIKMYKKPGLTEKILLEAGENVLDKHILNPETGNQIKVSSALTYAETSSVYKTAKAMVDKTETIVGTPTGKTKKVVKKKPVKRKKVAKAVVNKEPKKLPEPKDPNSRSHKPKSASYGISKECAEFLKAKGFTGLNAMPQSFVKPEDIKFNPALKTKGKDSVWVAQFPFMLKNGQTATKTVYTQGFMKKSQIKKYKKISKISTKDIESLEEKSTKLLKAKDKNTADSAAVIAIILKTGLRVGSADQSEGEGTGNLGVRTLLVENISINGDTAHLKFIGKSYQENVAETNDPAIVEYLSKAIANKGPKDRVFNCTYGQVNKVMDQINPKGIHPKDLRTYKAGAYAKQLLDDKSVAPPPLPTEQKELKNVVKAKLAMVFEKVSALLNNSPTMARNSYVHPVIITDFLNNLGLTPKLVGYKHVTLPEAVQLKESIVTPEEKEIISREINFLKNHKVVGPSRYAAIRKVIKIAQKYSKFSINGLKDALLAIDWIEPKAYNDGKATNLNELDIADVSEDLNSNMDDFYSKYEDDYEPTTMDEMFEQNSDYGEGVDTNDISDEDSDDCEEYELPEWYNSDDWDLCKTSDNEVVKDEINKFIK
ncbi:MAG: hypothetical protein ABIP51_04130 [Bacteroidia bacterium]